MVRASLAASACGLLLFGACAGGAASRADAPSAGVADYDRPPGMPIGTGTGASGGELEAEPPRVSNNTDLAIPEYAPAAPSTAAVPCSGCVELDVYVNDINQRDEFAVGVAGGPITRVVWTLLVNFNSDQLAVQPFVDDTYGKYTNLHVNGFPLGTPVQVEQDVARGARTIGLAVGSSGAWTGDQTMRVFVDSVRVEGPHPVALSFDTGADGLAPRTDQRQPKVVWHPAR
jgi:hypothetical protein